MKTNEKIKSIGGEMHVAELEYWRMYGNGELPTDNAAAITAISLAAIERAAETVRCYGEQGGLALLCGRILARMENSPKQAGEFAVQVAQTRTDGCTSHIEAVAQA